MWYKVTKNYRGGQSEFQIQVPVKLSSSDWDCVFEWLGENTNGGHNYGYSLKSRKLKTKSEKLAVVQYPSGLCAKLMNYGETVITTQKMI